MGRCNYEGCSIDDSFPHECSYCNRSFCSHHRLPENHDCVGLRNANTLGPEFRSVKQSVESSSPEKTDKKERKQCSNCTSYIPFDKERCLSCRRKEQLLSSTSPDLNPDGTLRKTDQDPDSEPRSNRRPSLLSVKLVFGRIARKLGYRGRIHQFFILYKYAFVAVFVLLLSAGVAFVLL